MPFVYQIFCEELAQIGNCLRLCLTTALILFIFELVQMKHRGLDYFNETWNIVDQLHFFSYIFYFFLRRLEIKTHEDAGGRQHAQHKGTSVPDVSWHDANR